MTLAVFAVLIAICNGWKPLMLAGGTGKSHLFIIVGFALLGFSHAQTAGAVAEQTCSTNMPLTLASDCNMHSSIRDDG